MQVIYISYTNSTAGVAGANGKKVLTEAEAKAKADALLKRIKAGADFVKLVKENSEDPVSVVKDGDFGTIKKSEAIPDEVKSAVFSLSKGQVSNPVKQPNGFYLFRVEDAQTTPFEKVRDDIYSEIQNSRFREWFETQRASVKVTFEDEKYFAKPAQAAPGAVPAPVK